METFLSGPGLARTHAALGHDRLAAEQIAGRRSAGSSASPSTSCNIRGNICNARASIRGSPIFGSGANTNCCDDFPWRTFCSGSCSGCAGYSKYPNHHHAGG